MISPRRICVSLVLLTLVLVACEPVGGLRRRRPSFADHGDQEAAVTATTIDGEWQREEGWAVAPVLDTPEGATRVSALLTMLSADAPLPTLSARGLMPATDWLALTLYYEDGEARVATVDFGVAVEAIELRLLESELESLIDLRFSGSDPALALEEEAIGATSAGLAREELRAELVGLGIVTREEWGAGRGTCTSRDGARRRISIHHTETGSVDPARQLRSIQSYHRSKGWCDVGYHFLVGADGRIYEGRPVELLGAHVRDNNAGNLDISFIGCFDARDCATPTTITDGMIENAGRLVGTLADLYGITVSSSTVRGHRDQVWTSCPGDALYARIGDIVAIGQRARLGSDAPPPVTPPSDPPPSGAVCRHSLGGTYAAGACSESYQCCEGTWRSRSPGCGACACVETTGRLGCTGTSVPPSEPPPSDPPSDPRAVRLPPTGAGVDYQLGGPYTPPAGTGIVSRDRTAAPAPGLYNICYVNGFQTQPGDESFWLDGHTDLILRDGAGAPVIDSDWSEMLLDVSTAAKRAALADIVGGWIRGCARAGFDAIEIDNLDSHTRSGGRLTESSAVSFMRLLSDVAHAEGLAIAQKNATELLARRAEMGTDFAVSEECNRYGECGQFTAAYGDHVLVIEYRRADFDAGCRAFPSLPTVLRDLPLSTPGSAGYVHDECHGSSSSPPSPAPPGPPAGASCTHSFGGSYANTACSASYQCFDGSWRTRGSCGSCYCVEESGTSGCGASSTPPAPAPGGSGLPYAGLTLSGSEVPRAGLANATLRSALGLSTEPYGTVTTFEGSSYVRGRVSWFGGPRDTGVTTTETGAITGERLRSLNSPLDPSASTLSSRPADYYYVAMRWAYSPNGTRWWRDARLVIVNPANGRAIVVRPVDWGPNTSTRRILDLSPQALSDLGLSTDGEALVAFAPAGTPLGRVR